MKKLIALLLALVCVCCLFGCAATDGGKETTDSTTESTTENTTEDTTVSTDGIMSYDEYVAAELETEVTIACWVQATQSWWEDKITVYAADENGAYFLYEMACSQADAAKLVPGTLLKVTGTKSEWAGEVEVVDATFQFVDGGESYIAKAEDLTQVLGTDDMIKYQNQLALFTGMTVKEISYKNDEPGDDIYVTLTKDGEDYSFCVERYLTDPDTEVYKTVGTLKAGDTVDVEGFVYWYEGMNPHITKITVK